MKKKQNQKWLLKGEITIARSSTTIEISAWIPKNTHVISSYSSLQIYIIKNDELTFFTVYITYKSH